MLPILVIDNNDIPVYQVCRYIWRSNVEKYKSEIKLLFLRSSSDIPVNEIKIDRDCIYVNKVESTNVEITNKTIAAIRHCLKNYEFNHLLRTNLSSFYAINNLLRSLNNLPKTNCYAGYQGIFQNDQDIISFCSGSGYLISRDICEYLCLNSDSCEIGALNDDVWVGKVLQGIPRTGLPRTDFYIDTTLGVQLIKKLSEMTKNGELEQGIHFRVKCINEFERINVDSFILFFLYNYFNIGPNKKNLRML